VHTAFTYARARAEHARRVAIAGLVAAAAATPAAAANWSDKYGDPRSAISSPDYPNAGTPRGDAALAAAARSSGWSSTSSGSGGYVPLPNTLGGTARNKAANARLQGFSDPRGYGCTAQCK
jgi:peptidoglycan/LPS O-acetylase OafA/YrhL